MDLGQPLAEMSRGFCPKNVLLRYCAVMDLGQPFAEMSRGFCPKNVLLCYCAVMDVDDLGQFLVEISMG